MKTFGILLLAFATVSTTPAKEVCPFIVGGVNALPGEFPFIVSIQHRIILGSGDHICGGSIISDMWVLTTAHCLTESSTRGTLEAVAGKHNLNLVEEGEQRREIERNRWLVHPGWTAGQNIGPNDVALARLSSPLVFNARIQTIRIPPPDSQPNGPATFAGWGATSNGIGSGPTNILQKAMFMLVSNEVCRNAIIDLGRDDSIIDDAKFCTGPMTGGFSACEGDFGGPLTQGSASNEVIIGVSTWGVRPCGLRGAPTGVYMRVSAYSNWITANTGVSH